MPVSQRNRLPWKAVAAGLGLVGVGAFIYSRLTRKPEPLGRLALIGDSYAVGLGPELAKLLDGFYEGFKYEGHVGASTHEWAARVLNGQWGTEIAAFKPKTVLVSLGVNDGSAPNADIYRSFVAMIQASGARVIWIEPPAAVNTASRAVIASLGVQTIPATTTPLAADGLHPASYVPWAYEIAGAIT